MESKFLSQPFLNRMMGPHAVMLLEEALSCFHDPINPKQIIDLGCGQGLTSIYLSDHFKAQITAVDFWITAEENSKFFQEQGYEKSIRAVHQDARKLSLPKKTFDMLASIDAYHYFGLNKDYFNDKIGPHLVDGALVCLVIVGRKGESDDPRPDILAPYISPEDWQTFKPQSYYEELLSTSLKDIQIKSLTSQKQAWNIWLSLSSNRYAVGDRAFIEVDDGRYIDIFAIVGRW